MKLFLENGRTAGLKDVCKWWIHWYPEDIFVSEPVLVCKARDSMKGILEILEMKKS